MNKYLLPILFSFLVAINLHAQSSTFTYQGKLTDGGSPANGTYLMQFSLFDAPANGNQIGQTQDFGLLLPAVQVTNGVFSVQLDFGAPVPPFDNTPRFDGSQRWLQINVRKVGELSYTFLSPRQPITSTPYSIKSNSTASADSVSLACVLCVTNGHIQSVDGNKVTGTVSNASSAAVAGNVSGVVGITNGGTGSSTKNFVDLSADQSIAGNKTFSGSVGVTGANGVFNGNGSGLTNLNASNIAAGSLNIPLGQDATTVFSTSLITTDVGLVEVPGLSQTVTVPANSVVMVSTDGSVQTSSSSPTAWALTEVFIVIDGVIGPAGTSCVITSTNSPVTGLPATWGFTRAYQLLPGQHTIAVEVVRAVAPGSVSAATGGAGSVARLDSMTVTILKK